MTPPHFSAAVYSWLKPVKVCVLGIRPFRQIILGRPAAGEIADITQFFNFSLKQCSHTTFRRNSMVLALEGGEQHRQHQRRVFRPQ